ncbi:hypothetical protein OYB34_14430, partial [Escherichia coli]|nr:hypothetical protein [Escherichia coli]
MSTANTWSSRQTFNGGITGALAGNADTATKLKTKRSLQVDLQSDNAIDFDGSSNALLGIKGILPITHGGLGASSVSGGRTNLGLGVADIPQFKGINLVNSTDADLAASGIVSGYLGTVAKLAMRQPFVLFKGLTFQKLCLPGAFRPGDHHN